jgi:acetyl esterase/lipase
MDAAKSWVSEVSTVRWRGLGAAESIAPLIKQGLTDERLPSTQAIVSCIPAETLDLLWAGMNGLDMKRQVIAACMALPLAIGSLGAAQTSETLLLWPEGAPGALGTADKDRPSMTVYHAPPAEDVRPAIIICPGGGYGHLALDHEGHEIARWANSLGITGIVLEYRHRGKGYGHPAPLQDAQRAIRSTRARAKEWGIDPGRVGILGFSAGGHLASSASVHFDGGQSDAVDPVERQPCRPDFSVLCYPVIAFGQPFTHMGSQINLLGKEAESALVLELSSERQVTKNTPPAFLFHTTADKAVPVQNSLVYYLALVEQQVPCELHVFEEGRHGIGLAKGHAAAQWPELCQRWLLARGVLAVKQE